MVVDIIIYISNRPKNSIVVMFFLSSFIHLAIEKFVLGYLAIEELISRYLAVNIRYQYWYCQIILISTLYMSETLKSMPLINL